MALYDDDFYLWTQEQAAALRRLADQRANLPLDLANLAEEVEDWGKSEHAALYGQLVRLLQHALKLEFSPARDPRGDWQVSVLDARSQLALRMTGAMRRRLLDDLARAYRDARRQAAVELRSHGERLALPQECPYRLTDALADDWWPENRHGIVDEVSR